MCHKKLLAPQTQGQGLCKCWPLCSCGHNSETDHPFLPTPVKNRSDAIWTESHFWDPLLERMWSTLMQPRPVCSLTVIACNCIQHGHNANVYLYAPSPTWTAQIKADTLQRMCNDTHIALYCHNIQSTVLSNSLTASIHQYKAVTISDTTLQ